MAKQNILKKFILLTSSLSVTFSALLCAPNAGAAFSDVGDDDRYKTAITMLSKLNVIDGYDDGEFKQDNQITRAEFTKIMVYMPGFG
ncbi:MAG: S-layer homology domain-containing protein [Clostridiales bacterium]|nr:S-layer homology domain-containing protein [Clostridiales bacterium]